MISSLLTKLFGSRNQRTLKSLNKIVKAINALEPQFESLSDAELKNKTVEFRTRLAENESLDDILPEAFATVREASRRVFEMRHFDVQMIGGMVLNSGSIAEMRTGEGKTLTATLPAYLNGLTGKGVHVITVNDYLASRDSEYNRPLFEFLGISVGCNIPGMNHEEKKAAYQADITYGTNNEFGFDYLRDNMAFSADERVQKSLNFALIDEVDSILIDEARTPLIISGPAEDNSEIYIQINKRKVESLSNQIKNLSKVENENFNTLLAELTKRQKEVYNLIISGKTNKEIISELFIEHSTLKSHINQIYKKLNIKNRNELKSN